MRSDVAADRLAFDAVCRGQCKPDASIRISVSDVIMIFHGVNLRACWRPGIAGTTHRVALVELWAAFGMAAGRSRGAGRVG